MYIHNITFGVDPAVEQEFVKWLLEEFIPVSTERGAGYFDEHQLLRVHSADPEANTLALHLHSASDKEINDWYADHGARLFSEIQRHWPQKVVFFATTLSSL